MDWMTPAPTVLPPFLIANIFAHKPAASTTIFTQYPGITIFDSLLSSSTPSQSNQSCKVEAITQQRMVDVSHPLPSSKNGECLKLVVRCYTTKLRNHHPSLNIIVAQKHHHQYDQFRIPIVSTTVFLCTGLPRS